MPRSGRSSAPGAPGRSADDLGEWLAFALAACDAADEIALHHFRRDLEVMTKPDRSFVTVADQGDRAAPPRADPCPVPGPRAGRRGVRRGGGRGHDALVHRPDRRDPQLHPRRAAVRDAARARGRRRGPGRRPVRAGPARALVRVARRRRLGRRRGRAPRVPGASASRGSPRSTTPRCSTARPPSSMRAAWCPASATSCARSGASAASATSGATRCSRRAPRRRCSRSTAKTWDLAAPLVLIEEAGGRLTDFSGQRRIDRQETIASNGLLHEAVLARLRTVPD